MGFLKKVYLIQYGKYRDGRFIEAGSELSAIQEYIKEYARIYDFEHPIFVTELSGGKEYKIETDLTIREIK